MAEKFDYAENIGALSLERKRKFYVLFAHDLTVSVRAIWSDENLADDEKVEGMKWINEIMHQLIFRVEKLHIVTKLEDDSYNEKDFYEIIYHWTSQNHKTVANHVAWSIKSSYERCLKIIL